MGRGMMARPEPEREVFIERSGTRITPEYREGDS